MRTEQASWEESLAISGETSPDGDWSEAICSPEKKVSKGRVRSAGWKGTSRRRARSLRRRSPVRWSGVPRVRSRRSHSLSRSRGERRVCRESPAVVRVTQCGRSPRRRTVPQKRQDSAAVRCVRVGTEEVRSQSEVVWGEGESTLEEVKVVVCEEGTAEAVEKTEEERIVVTGVEMETSDSTAGTTAICDICRVLRRLLCRHIESMHLPWFFRPENSCWKCQWAECSSLHLEKRHWKRHDDEGKFTDQRLATWCESVKAILGLLARQLGKALESLGGIRECERMASGYGTNSVRHPWGSGGAVGCVLEGDSRDCRYSLSEWRGSSSPLEDNDTLASWGARRGQVTGAPGTTGGWFCRSLAGSCSHRWTLSSGVDASASWLESYNRECTLGTCRVPWFRLVGRVGGSGH